MKLLFDDEVNSTIGKTKLYLLIILFTFIEVCKNRRNGDLKETDQR